MERENNFDFIRLILASLVIFSHSYPLAGYTEIFEQMTDKQLNMGAFSVEGFFILSGYLIMISLRNSKTMISYMWKRYLRLFPALFVMLIITMLLLIVVYEGEDLFVQKDYFTYFRRNITLYRAQYHVKGIFESNPYPRAINGSLWSLSYEFTMYIIMLLLFPFRKMRIALILLIAIWSFCVFTNHYNPLLFTELSTKIYLNSDQFYRLGAFFMGGSILSYVNLKKINKPYIKLGLLIILIGSLFFNFYKTTSYIVLPLLMLLVCISYSKKLNYIPHRIGDISYGVYIYGFLVQQTLMYYYSFSPILLTLISLPITYIAAFLSWQYIEKPALQYKNFV